MTTMSGTMKKTITRAEGVSDGGDVQIQMDHRQKQHVVEIIDGGIEDDESNDDL